jgi:3-deoxy-D-manno-octulosonate 8-phosphate phosphatase (KDO 8-P phosphatase)
VDWKLPDLEEERMKSDALAARCRRLKLLLFDVDGVLTDGTVAYHAGGGESRSFHIRDGLGIVLAHRAGLLTGILSGRSSEATSRRAAELRMSVVRQGASDKLAVFREILAETGLQPAEVAYMGDDVNDLAVLAEVGLAAAPADAPLDVRAQAFMVMDAAGGRGCARELIEAVLRARGDWDDLLASVAGATPVSGA